MKLLVLISLFALASSCGVKTNKLFGSDDDALSCVTGSALVGTWQGNTNTSDKIVINSNCTFTADYCKLAGSIYFGEAGTVQINATSTGTAASGCTMPAGTHDCSYSQPLASSLIFTCGIYTYNYTKI